MDVRKISPEELDREGFVFMDMSDLSGRCGEGEPVSFDGLLLGICSRGSMDFRINYREFHVGGHEMFIVFPKHILTVLGYSDGMELKLLLVSPEFLYRLPLSPDLDWLKKAGTYPCLPLTEDKREEMQALYLVMQKYGTDTKLSCQIRSSLMLSLALIIKSVYEDMPADGAVMNMSRREQLTRSFFDLMLNSYMSERRVTYYADRLCVTPKYLSAAVKSVTGHTVQEWINEALVVEAKRCLLSSDTTVLQIAELLSFPSASSFIRFFRQHSGLTPAAYRRR